MSYQNGSRGKAIAALVAMALFAMHIAGCASPSVSTQQSNKTTEIGNADTEAAQPNSTEAGQAGGSDGLTDGGKGELVAEEEEKAVMVSKKTVYDGGESEWEEYNEDGTILYQSFDESGNLTLEYLTDEEGNQFYRRSYDNGSLRAEESNTYDGAGKLLTQIYNDYLNPEYSTRTEYTYTPKGETARIQMYYTDEDYLSYVYEAVYSDGRITSIAERYADEETHEFTEESREEYQYNEHGDRTEMLVASYSLTDGSCLSNHRTVYQNDYDSYGRLISCREDMYGETDEYPDREKYVKTTNTYDTDGNVIQNTWLFYRLDYYGNESLDYNEENATYYADGTKAWSCSNYHSDYSWGSSWSRNESEYDEAGREVRYCLENENDTRVGTYVYDEHGNEVSWVLESSDGEHRERITTYKYDEFGNIIFLTCNDDGSGYVTEYKYTYMTQNADTYESVYQELLQGICEMLRTEDSGTDAELVSAVENGVFEARYSGVSEELSECVGYALRDMNADGKPELVVCTIAEEKGGQFRGRDICAVYTCVQDEIYCICSGWSRNYVGWMGDNRFCYLGSGGASNSLAGQYILLPNATEWSCEDLYFTEENGIYHNQTGAFEAEESEKSDMTEEQFWELWDGLEESVLEFELTPFATLAADGC